MEKYIPVKKSQLAFYKNVPYYCLSKSGDHVLYKKPGTLMEKNQLAEAKLIDIYIHQDDRRAAIKDLLASLNMDLAQKIAQKGVQSVKTILCQIVDEALFSPLEHVGPVLPETIEIMFYGHSKNSELLEGLTRISSGSKMIVEHSTNVLAFSMLYCCIHDIPVNMSKIIGISALLHDIGATLIEKEIIESDEKLSSGDYERLKMHPQKGYDLILDSTQFHRTVATVALERHEKLDGSGYPKGASLITFEGQLIGLIDSYEALTYRDKAFRKAKMPFDTMKILKNDVLEKKYDKEIFKNFCLCLTR
jgi:HD-GYP domain-containing protein (c-di-GMP phosphodiesterase class II)